MEIKEIIGIDISKKTFDAFIQSQQVAEVFENTNVGFKEVIKWAYKNSSFDKCEILFIFEHTGLYSHQLMMFLSDKSIPFSMVPGLEIKRSLGISRGKDDKTDAKKIALYGFRLRDEIKPFVVPSIDIMKLRRLLTLRERLVKQNAGFKASFKEQKKILNLKENKSLFRIQQKAINFLSKQIKEIEIEMIQIINNNPKLSEIYYLITTIKGVGPQIALFMIVTTHAFTKFKNARKFASYCGIAPFPNTSGTSIRGQTKVSHLANKKIKSLLELGARSAIQSSPEMKEYYNKRIENGKNKTSTLNIIRNKLVARIFAVVERRTPYVDLRKYAA